MKTEYATSTARAISAKLKKAGFSKFDAKYSPYGYDKKCEGFFVSCNGRLPEVMIRWTSTAQRHDREHRGYIKSKTAELLVAVANMGYAVNDKGHVVCDSYDANY